MTELNANFNIEDNVEFYPTHKQSQEMGIAQELISGKVISIKFTKAKVFYNILNDYHGIIFENIPSEKVFSTESMKLYTHPRTISEKLGEILNYKTSTFNDMTNAQQVDIQILLHKYFKVKCIYWLLTPNAWVGDKLICATTVRLSADINQYEKDDTDIAYIYQIIFDNIAKNICAIRLYLPQK